MPSPSWLPWRSLVLVLALLVYIGAGTAEAQSAVRSTADWWVCVHVRGAPEQDALIYDPISFKRLVGRGLVKVVSVSSPPECWGPPPSPLANPPAREDGTLHSVWVDHMSSFMAALPSAVAPTLAGTTTLDMMRAYTGLAWWLSSEQTWLGINGPLECYAVQHGAWTLAIGQLTADVLNMTIAAIDNDEAAMAQGVTNLGNDGTALNAAITSPTTCVE